MTINGLYFSGVYDHVTCSLSICLSVHPFFCVYPSKLSKFLICLSFTDLVLLMLAQLEMTSLKS
jgi:hypothetical protein